MSTFHPLLVETAKAYSGHPAMGGLFDDLTKSLSTEWDKAKTQLSAQVEAEKQKAIQQGLTSVQTAATKLVNDQAQKLLNDPKKIEEIRQSAVPKIVDQINQRAITPVVDYVTKNPKKVAIIAGGIGLAAIIFLTLKSRSAIVGLKNKLVSNP